MSARILLIRHGETDWNREKRIQGQLPEAPGLNETGRAQALSIGKRMGAENVAVLYSSPAKRARETASLAWKGDIRFVPELAERTYGELEGRRWDEVKAARPDLYQAYEEQRRLPGVQGGEMLEAVGERALAAFGEIVRKEHAGTVAVITHGIVIKTILAALLGAPAEAAAKIKVSNGSISAIEYDAKTGKVNIVGVNDTRHLKGEMQLQVKDRVMA